MTAYLLTNHLLNFVAPAAAVALLMVLLTRPLSRWFGAGKSMRTARAQFLIVFAVNLLVLVAGLLVFGHDGKMTTYALLVIVAAVAQWINLGGLKR